jgi:hypothetical protein
MGVECGGAGGAGECCGVICRCNAGNAGWPCAGLAVPDVEREESTVDADDERPVIVGRFCQMSFVSARILESNGRTGARMEPSA